MKNAQQLTIVVLHQRIEVNILQVNCKINHTVFAFPSQVPGEYLSPGEVAFLFNIHERTVRKWACKGRLKRYRFDHNTMFYKRQELIPALISMNF